MNEIPEQMEAGREQRTELGASAVKTPQGVIYTLSIIGQIEGHQTLPENVKTTKYEHVLPLLAGIEENEEISGLLLLLNTVGGDIEAGLAIAELISGMRKPTVSLVLGGRPLHRCTAGRRRQALHDCKIRQHDHPSRTDDWDGRRRAADLSVF